VSLGGGLWALARLAWRDAARHPGRSLLVATVLALPTAMLASATVVLCTSDLAAGRSFGQSNLFMLVFLPIVAVAALTAAAALGVGGRRQLRELGLLAAAGGSGRHLRLLVLLQRLGLGCSAGWPASPSAWPSPGPPSHGCAACSPRSRRRCRAWPPSGPSGTRPWPSSRPATP
jgi:hypothetical protein